MAFHAIRIIILSLIFTLSSWFFASDLFATITVTSVTGMSRYELPTTTSEKLKIFGGTAGVAPGTGKDPNEAAVDNVSTFNSCQSRANPNNNTLCTFGDGTDCNFYPCNESRIYDNLMLQITFTSDNSSLDTATAASLAMYLNNASGTQTSVTTQTNYTTQYGSIKKGNTLNLAVRWADICASATGSSCETLTSSFSRDVDFGIILNNGSSLTEKLTVTLILQTLPIPTATDELYYSNCPSGTSQSTGGACYFSVFPGDGKVFVNGFNVPTNFPTITSTSGATSSATYKFILFFFETGASNTPDTFLKISRISPSSSYMTFATTSPYSLDNTAITGLNNGATYYFRMATVDQAMNIGHFSKYSSTDSSNYLTADLNSATPAEVNGVLNSDKCFIATATYGSLYAPKVKDFRKFRDQFLLQSAWGRKFVAFYYQYSPYYANIIAHHEWLKSVAAIFLWPFWGLAKIVLDFIWIFYLCIFCFSIGVSRFFWLRRKKKRTLSIEKQLKKVTFLFLISLLGFSSWQKAQAYDDTISTNYDSPANESKTRQSKKIHHPWAKKGLEKIGADGAYHFKTDDPRPHTQAISLRIGTLPAPQYTSDQGISFSDIYGSTPLTTLFFDYGWQFNSRFGLLGAKAGGGLATQTGHGQISVNGETKQSIEAFNFYVVPASLAVVYGFRYSETQWMIPYIEGGIDYIMFGEQRNDGAPLHKGATPGSHIAAGLSFYINVGDSKTSLETEYGINSLWLTAELRQLITSKNNFDFTSTGINLGLTVEY